DKDEHRTLAFGSLLCASVSLWLVSSSERPGEAVDLLGVEHLVVALEQAGDGRPVDLHLGAAHAEGAVTEDALVLGAAVEHPDALDAQWLDGVQVDGEAQGRA